MKIRIATTHAELLFDIMTRLAATKHACTTADIGDPFAGDIRSYGSLARWLRSKVSNTDLSVLCWLNNELHDNIANKLSEVDNDFDLPLSKITSTVTNNGSNYKKKLM